MFLINFNKWKCACVGINNWVSSGVCFDLFMSSCSKVSQIPSLCSGYIANAWRKEFQPSSFSFCSFINVQHSYPYKDIISAVSVMWNFTNLFFGIRSFFDSFCCCVNQTYFKQTTVIRLSKVLYAEFYETLNFLLVLTTVRPSFVSWASWVSSLGPYYIFTYFCVKKSTKLRQPCYHNRYTKRWRCNYISLFFLTLFDFVYQSLLILI